MKSRAIEDPAACHAELAPVALYEHAATVLKPSMSVLQAHANKRELTGIYHLKKSRL